MALGGVYNTGTVAVTNGSPTVVGTGVFWPDVLEGDHLVIAGLLSLVLSVNTSTSTITLMKPYGGATNATATYQLVKMSWLRYDPSTVMYQVRDFLSRINDSNTGLLYYSVGTPDPAIGENGDIAINVTVSPWMFWLKVSGVWVVQAPLVGPTFVARTFFANDTTFWVRSDGNNANDGLVDSAARAFQTWQGAFLAVRDRYDFRGLTAWIRKGTGGSGSFNAGVSLSPWVGGGVVIFDGGSSVGCAISCPSGAGSCFTTGGPLSGNVVIQNMKLISVDGGGLLHYTPGKIRIGNDVDFGACGAAHLAAIAPGAFIELSGISYKVSGSTFQHLIASRGAAIELTNCSVTFSGSPSLFAFAQAVSNGSIESSGSTFSGAVSGVRYIVAKGGQINTGGGGANYFPGSTPGQVQDATSFYS